MVVDHLDEHEYRSKQVAKQPELNQVNDERESELTMRTLSTHNHLMDKLCANGFACKARDISLQKYPPLYPPLRCR